MADSNDKGSPDQTAPTSSVDIQPHDQPTPTSSSQVVTQPPAEPSMSMPIPSVAAVDRRDLVSKARAFLYSPQIQYQSFDAKRRFLADKGLSHDEVDMLMREQVQAPAIPPRTYPQAPPSNLPAMLLGLLRLFSWIGAGSAALIFAYYRYLLPRLIRSAEARHSLRTHHISLMQRLTASLSSLKESQSESLADLPRHDPYRESDKFALCRTLSSTLKALGDAEEPNYSDTPPVTLLRCAIADFGKGKDGDDAQPTTEEVFLLLEGRIPWLASPEGYSFKKIIFDTLIACPLFEESSPATPLGEEPSAAALKWKYLPPPPPTPSPVIESLARLNSAFPPPRPEARSSVFQHALETLSEFTGYISTHVYVPYRAPIAGMGLSGNSLGPAEEALKKEIRALKGLVLNRKSFMPSIPRPPPFKQHTTT